MIKKQLSIFNTLSGKKEKFKPLKGKTVKMYACGPTVYWYAHLGNFRTYILSDILRRVLKYNGYKIKQVMNITDVEDKIIKKAKEEKKDIFKITEPYTKFFFEDLKKLNIEKSEFYPRATDYIKEMTDLIEKLMTKGFAYKGNDCSIYFKISKFKKYGELSRLQKRTIKIGARISADTYTKEEAQDFVLWKTAKTQPKKETSRSLTLKTRKKYILINGEPAWPSAWGWGRPGWHIECSAMSMKCLGSTLDIHSGGIDLIFPHHENEIAQSEAATGKKFVNYLIHGGHLLVNNESMSKSLKNIYTVKDLQEKKINPLAFRYLILTSHYRSKLNFTWESVQANQNALNSLYSVFQSTYLFQNSTRKNTNNKKNKEKTETYKKEFLKAINDDLNLPKALSIAWQIIKDDNLSTKSKKEILIDFDKVFGLGFNKIKPLKIPQEIKRLLKEREELRSNQQFIQADHLRKKIEGLGYKIEDLKKGIKIFK